MEQSIQMVVFDMAGTTVADNDYVARAFQDAFEINGMTIRRGMVNPLMGYHKPLAIQMVLEQLGVEFDAELIEKIHDDFEDAMVEFYMYAPEVTPLPGAEELFLYLKEKGVHIALNTGFSKVIADTIINRFEWKERNLVDDHIGSNEVEMGRPYPFMIKELMQRTGINDPQCVAKVGDTTVDIEEGRNAGCRYIISVTTGAATVEELEKMNPTHIVNSLEEIPAILQLAIDNKQYIGNE
ncbi:MAG TPA: HAD hydrolase-like protein [Chitinophagaceae bacterium]|jgi:phosphonatase-like hydrolase|nr:HAD hydrolase-like protein [Chitinophagaceae bacterium]